VRRVQDLHQGANLLGVAAFLENEPIIRVTIFATVDDAGGNCRSAAWHERLGAVESKGEKIAIA
jgi:hypothetical protein